ncbi:MAG TPA: arylesterase [Patescibacteria group bacterium]|nr:arylesterase [Patescibacteria group bacterium]
MKSWSLIGTGWYRPVLWAYGLVILIVNFTAHSAMAATPLHILAFGDSLTAGYMLPAADAFPAKLEQALRAKGYAVEIVNAGVSGDTTSGGRARLEWTLGSGAPDFAIVELGANDALRGIDPALAYANLDAILDTLRQHGVKTLLAGMVAPRNLGADYAAAFDPIYPRLKQKYGIPLYPFFLEGVTLHPELTLADGLHPNPQGVDVIVRGILPQVVQLIGPPPAKAAGAKP